MPITLKDIISREYKDKPRQDKLIEFWRTAASSAFDIARFECDAARNEGPTADKWLLRYEHQSDSNWRKMLFLSQDPGFAQTVVELYSGYAAQVPVKYDKSRLPVEIVQAIDENFDGCGHGVEEFAQLLFAESLRIAQVPVMAIRKDDKSLPYSMIVPRESVMDFSRSLDRYDFFKYRTKKQIVDGITVSDIDCIYYLTKTEFGGAEFDKKWVQLEPMPNGIYEVPVSDVICGDVPIIHSVAKLQLNLYNLDAEQRRLIRNQGGLNFLTAEDDTKINVLGDQTVLFRPRGSAKPEWVGYPSSGLEAHQTYWTSRKEYVFQNARLRASAPLNQSGVSKRFDFMDVEAVINHVCRQIEHCLSEQVRFWMLFYKGQDVRIDFDLDTSAFIPAELTSKLQDVLTMQAAGFPKAITDDVILKIASAYKVSPEAILAAQAEMQAGETPAPPSLSTPQEENNVVGEYE